EQPDIVTAAKPVPTPRAPAELVLHDISFRHPGRQPQIIDGGRARFPVGSKVVLTGPSGSGKLTLLDLLQRYYDPDLGHITYGGGDLRELDLADYRKRLAVVRQDIVLFRASLADNLRYAAPEATDEEVAGVVRLAQLEELVASLPEGLDTRLG